MTVRALCGFALLLLWSAAPAQVTGEDPGYFARHAEGWFWYRDPPPSPEDVEESPAETVPAPSPEPDPIEALEHLRERLEHAMAAALMEPSEENVRAYLALDHEARARAGRFAAAWQRVVWTTPGLDHRQVRPVNDQAVQVFNDERVRLLDERLRAAAKEHGLFFFFRASCPFCHRFAPVLKAFADRYGFEVVAITLDGGALPGFPAPRRNARMAERLNVDTVPALFLAHPRNGAIYPVAFGYVGTLELAERIYTLIEGEPPNPLLATRQAGAR